MIKQQFSSSHQAILEEQAKCFDQAVEGQLFIQILITMDKICQYQSESESYGEIYDHLFDSFVFKYTFGKILQSGEAIGGIDILNNKSRREAVLCINDCELGYISKSDYIDILKEIEEAKFNKKLNRLFFDKLIESLDPDIPHLSRLMSRLVSFLKKEKYQRGQVIYHQNEEVKGCYLITDGEIEIAKELVMNPPECHNDRYAYRQIQQNKQHHTVAYVAQGQYIGEEEMVLEEDKRTTSAICNSYKCKVYFIEKSHFLKLISDQLDIKLAFVKSIKQKTKFNSQKFNQLKKIIQKNYFQKFEERDTTPTKHLQKYRDSKNQFRDCFQKILFLEQENQKNKEIPKSQERIGGISRNQSAKKDRDKKQIVLKKKSKSQHVLKDKNNILNVSLKIKEHQNNTSEALTEHYINQSMRIQQLNEQKQNPKKQVKNSVSCHFESQYENNENKNDNQQVKQHQKKPKLDMIDYLLKGNKRAKCQVTSYLKHLQKRDTNKQKMSKTMGSNFYQGVYQKITEDLTIKMQQEESNLIFLPESQEQNEIIIKNVHIVQQKQKDLFPINEPDQPERKQFCGPVSRPYTPDLDLWTKGNIKSTQNINEKTQSSIDNSLLNTQNKFTNILTSLSHNRNHETHLIKSHKFFKNSHVQVSQLIKKQNQLISVEDLQKSVTQKLKSLQNEDNSQQIQDKTVFISGQQVYNLVDKTTQNIPKANEEQKIENQKQRQSKNIEELIHQQDKMPFFHLNQVFKPKQRPLSSRNNRSSSLLKNRNISTDRETNANNTISNSSNIKFNKNDISLEIKNSNNNKLKNIVLINHMGQPKKYML